MFHSPESAEGRRKGGFARAHPRAELQAEPACSTPIEFRSALDVLKLLASTASDVRKQRMDPKTGNCISLICNSALHALSSTGIAEPVTVIFHRPELRADVVSDQLDEVPAPAELDLVDEEPAPASPPALAIVGRSG
jgi:hypothetical protein